MKSSAPALFFVPVMTEMTSPPAKELNSPSLPGMGKTPKSTLASSMEGMAKAPSGVMPILPLVKSGICCEPASFLAALGIEPSVHMSR